MSRLKAANNSQTMLTSLMEAGATSCTVVNGDMLPAVPFMLCIDNEIMEVGAKTGNSLSNILRAREGTVATTHQSGAIVENKMTAGMYNETADENSLDAHKAETAPHGATSDGTANKLMLRDASGRVKAVTGTSKDQVVTLSDKVNGSFTTGQTEISSIPLHTAGDYLLHVRAEISATSAKSGLYLVSRQGTSSVIGTIIANTEVEVSVDVDYKVNVKNISGGTRTIIFSLVRL